MNIFNGVSALFKGLTESKESVDLVAKGLYEGVDAVIFTDEEKSVANQKILDFEIKRHEATSNQNMARRLIAVEVTRVWVLLIVLAVGLTMFGLTDHAEYVLKMLMVVVTPPFTVITGFYFYKHVAAMLK